MSKADDAQDAANFALELLISEDRPAKALIAQAAAEYDLTSAVVEAWLARSFPSLDALAAWRDERRLALQNRADRQAKLEQVQTSAKAWAMGVWKNCEPDGQPLWPYCCDRFLETNQIKNMDHRRAAHRIFADIGKKFAAAREEFLKRKVGG